MMREEGLQRLRAGLVLADVEDELRPLFAHGFLPQPMIRGGRATVRTRTSLRSPSRRTSRIACSVKR